MGYTAGYLMFFVAGLIGFIRLAQGHGPGPLVVLSVLLSSLLVGAVGWLDFRAGRIEPPPGFMEGWDGCGGWDADRPQWVLPALRS